jgi:fumarylacetoacetase
MLELSWNGQNPVKLHGDASRTFIEDGDVVIMTGKCSNQQGISLGFGECVCPVKSSAADR